MKITREVKKQKAIELMNKLDIYKPYNKPRLIKNICCHFYRQKYSPRIRTRVLK